ncbi:MAG TPA: aminotransferase class V-fold PLP-dependent enzyme [Cytophagaceae bacterium]|jgi:dTDP-4-amino-4,6-dideoxygalactose transaminase
MPDFFEKIKEIGNRGCFILGKEVRSFENNFAEFCGTKYCVGTGSGLDALVLSWKALELPSYSEIIVPANTYIATVLAIVHAGLKPILVDAELETYNINLDLIEEKINPNTRAILAVHLYGTPCKMDQLIAVCEKNKLYLIEDCAQAHGAMYKNKRVGSFGYVVPSAFIQPRSWVL